MEITLNIKNTEEFVLSNKKVMSALTKYQPLYQTWLFASRAPALQSLRVNTVLEFLKLLQADDLKSISEIISKKVILDPNMYSLCLNYKEKIENIEFSLPLDFNISDLCIYRYQDKIGVTLWN